MSMVAAIPSWAMWLSWLRGWKWTGQVKKWRHPDDLSTTRTKPQFLLRVCFHLLDATSLSPGRSRRGRMIFLFVCTVPPCCGLMLI